MARASGVEPSGDWGKRAVKIVSCTVPSFVSITYTALLEAQATNRRPSFGMQHHLIGMLADGNAADCFQRLGIDGEHGCGRPNR